jgi:hypothetical protein
MTTPEQAIVLHDEDTHLDKTSPECHTSTVGGKIFIAAVTLALRLHFQNTTDQIMLGAVGVTIQPAAECIETIADLKQLDTGVVRCLTVLGYYTAGGWRRWNLLLGCFSR